MDYYAKDYKSWRTEVGLPSPECYDMEETLYTRRYYVTKRYLWGLIKVRVPVREVITRRGFQQKRKSL